MSRSLALLWTMNALGRAHNRLRRRLYVLVERSEGRLREDQRQALMIQVDPKRSANLGLLAELLGRQA